MFQLSTVARALALAGSVALAGAAQAELVTNGGFETGNFSGWTSFGNTGFQSVSGGRAVNTGSFGAYFGAVGSPGGIFQTLATTAGSTYIVSFWLGIDSGTPNSMTFNWNGGADELSFLNAAGQGLTRYTFLLTATSAATDLRFNIQHNPAFYFIDNISVNIPEPGSLALAGLALAGLALVSRRKQA